MSFYKAEGVNIKVARFAEADKLLTVFTREHGRISAIAKSGYKAGSKFGGRLEMFQYNSFLFGKGKNLDIVSQAETIESFHSIKEKEESLYAGLYIAKILYHFLQPGVRSEPLFDLVTDCFRLLKNGAAAGIVTRIFDVKMADIEGFLPMEDFSKDVRASVDLIRCGKVSSFSFSQAELFNIDVVLVPRMCEHIGKDIRSWKSI